MSNHGPYLTVHHSAPTGSPAGPMPHRNGPVGRSSQIVVRAVAPASESRNTHGTRHLAPYAALSARSARGVVRPLQTPERNGTSPGHDGRVRIRKDFSSGFPRPCRGLFVATARFAAASSFFPVLGLVLYRGPASHLRVREPARSKQPECSSGPFKPLSGCWRKPVQAGRELVHPTAPPNHFRRRSQQRFVAASTGRGPSAPEVPIHPPSCTTDRARLR